MATEISEVFFAAAMLDNISTLEKYLNDETTLRSYYNTCVQYIIQTGVGKKVTFADDSKRQEYLRLIELGNEGKLATAKEKEIRKDNLKVLTNLIQGMSAAMSFRQKIASDQEKEIIKSKARTKPKKLDFESMTPSVYMTGNVWPDAIQGFRVTIDDWEDYNSSDIVVSFDMKMYYGVSLKKKPNSRSPDPTLINKSFEEMLRERKSFSGLVEQIAAAKKEYLTNIAMSAVDAGFIAPQDIYTSASTRLGQKVWNEIDRLEVTVKSLQKKTRLTPTERKSLADSEAALEKAQKKLSVQAKKDWEAWTVTSAGREEMFACKHIDKKTFFREGKLSGAKYINVKGSPGNYWNVSDADMRNAKSCRFFVNKQLRDKENGLYSKYIEKMNDHATVFGDTLLSIVLKTKLESGVTQAMRGQGLSFGFYLVTGYGNISTKGDVTSSPGNSISLKTVLCGVSRISKMLGGGYTIVQTTKTLQRKSESGDQVESEAAKVYLALRGGSNQPITILDLELRFKGNFMNSPQFQAFISDEFKNMLNENCRGT